MLFGVGPAQVEGRADAGIAHDEEVFVLDVFASEPLKCVGAGPDGRADLVGGDVQAEFFKEFALEGAYKIFVGFEATAGGDPVDGGVVVGLDVEEEDVLVVVEEEGAGRKSGCHIFLCGVLIFLGFRWGFF